MKKIIDLIKKLKINDYCLYGDYIAKIKSRGNKKGKLILVTAINPTKYGEGKTTVSIGLCDSLNSIGINSVLALREPSLGPVFGMKGGATGGNCASLYPSVDINLHFTGDIHAITSANNLLCAAIDNHIYWGNKLKIKEILFNRCLDINDRALRDLTINSKIPHKEKFSITAASEIMAILCLSKDVDDLKKRLGEIIIGKNDSNNYIFCKDLKVEEAMTILLKDAINPNLVQTLEGSACFIHGGPFANIAHGCNSIICTNIALSYGDYVITEAGFGADLGAEKFLDIKCKNNNLNPSCIVLVATLRAINANKMENGIYNLKKHYYNLTKIFNQNVIIAINKFSFDKESELNELKKICEQFGAKTIVVNCFSEYNGAKELAKEVIKISNNQNELKFAYSNNDKLKEKINKVAKNIYGASSVEYSSTANEKIEEISNDSHFENFPICIAKTQYSLSDNPKIFGNQSFDFYVRDVEIKNGAKFIIVIAGEIMLMPGLPKIPNYENMQIHNDEISGVM